MPAALSSAQNLLGGMLRSQADFGPLQVIAGLVRSDGVDVTVDDHDV